MINEIQAIRDKIELAMGSSCVIPDERFVEFSPCGRYELEVNAYSASTLPDYPSIGIAVIRNVGTSEIVATVKRNDTRCFYCWITRDRHDYFLFPEDLEGQTVVDLTSRKIEGFSSPDDPFIWAEFHPSPDRMKLAIVGCYWACPYMVKVYDFREPMNLPLLVIAEFMLPGNNANFSEWNSASSFTFLDETGTPQLFDLTKSIS